MISGTINTAMETTGSLATNKNFISRLKNTLKFIQERKWLATCRYKPHHILPTTKSNDNQMTMK